MLGLIVNESCDISPWLARKLIRRAAYLQSCDPDDAAGRAEEWIALINDRPGKLFKLATAIGFLVCGVAVLTGRRARHTWAAMRQKLRLFRSLESVPEPTPADTGHHVPSREWVSIDRILLLDRDKFTADHDVFRTWQTQVTVNELHRMLREVRTMPPDKRRAMGPLFAPCPSHLEQLLSRLEKALAE
ncbi:hypothetical protein ACIBH1_45240 [Nonomuraea sp. NPDC050663]|uniref:hypothetical protein n=1 Tax=Nonomuraea sp. NPDC050663 TaxID=3364370 RepID=UPI0037ABE80A